ncbi:MAG: hypothetical protein IAG13_14175 [Deltaproteobacteria bacterium]|nr:hypothetical protein [Nannocystaceae bacterium]
MGLNIKAWNLGGLVGLVAGCGSLVVPTPEGEGDEPTSTDPQDSDDAPSSHADGPLEPQCQSDDECGYAQECRGGVCEYVPYCSTCCGDDCGGPDSGEYPECFEDTDCPAGAECLGGVCFGGDDVPQCGEPTLVVEALPIPVGDFGTNLVFVSGAGGGPDRLVLADEARIAVVPPDGTTVWHDASTALELPRRISVGDFDGNGDDEVMLAGTIDDVQVIAVYEIDSGAPELVGVSPGPAQNPAVGDFDGDGDDDVLTYVVSVGQSIYAAQGDGTFAPSVALELFEPWVFVADVDGDGRDEITTEGGVVMGVADDFELETRFELATEAPKSPILSLLADDFDGDGTRELFVARGWPQTWLEHTDTGGALVSAVAVPEGSAPMYPAALGGTTALDLALHAAVVRSPTGSPCVQQYAEPSSVQRIAAGDWDGDGRDEVVFKYEHTYDFAWARLSAQ